MGIAKIRRGQPSVKSVANHKEQCAALEYHAETRGGMNIEDATLYRCDCGTLESDGKAGRIWMQEVLEKLERWTGDLEDFTL